MTELPPDLPESGRHVALFRWLNKLKRAVYSLRPLQSLNTLTEGTTVGVYRQGTAKGTEGEATPFDWPKQWVDQDYPAFSTCIRKTADTLENGINEMDDGNLAGTYYCEVAVGEGEVPPGEDAPADMAIAEVTSVVDGAIDEITVTHAGLGYHAGVVKVLIHDDTGSGAEAEATIDELGQVTGITVTAGGSDYVDPWITFSETEQKWKDFALFRSKKFTLRVGQQRIVLDAGRDGTDLCKIQVFADKDDATAGSFSLDVADLLAIAGAGDIELKAREWVVCPAGINQKAIFLSSAAY